MNSKVKIYKVKEILYICLFLTRLLCPFGFRSNYLLVDIDICMNIRLDAHTYTHLDIVY